MKRLLWTCAGLVLAACQAPGDAPLSDHLPAPCASTAFELHADFDGARLGQCRVLAEGAFHLLNSPEDQPINHSPWYAFKVSGGPGPVSVTIEYSLHQHRYWPKVSRNGLDWSRLPPAQVQVGDNGRTVTLKLRKESQPLWVAGQPLLTADWYNTWYQQLLTHPGVQSRVIGRSVAGRPIHLLETNPGAQRTVLLVGRQHPPEVTGALGMYAFVQRLMEGAGPECTAAAVLCEFYRSTNIVMVPLMNPDGVALGHWRHGLGHIDLNRDWGPFTQPETRALRDEIDRLAAAGRPPRLFLDFHSTFKNVFYTQSVEEERQHGGFATRWLRIPAPPQVYEFEQQRRHNEGRPTAKNYMFARFGIPSVTYEVGDSANPEEITDSARHFADTMVQVLLDNKTRIDLLITGGRVFDGTGSGAAEEAAKEAAEEAVEDTVVEVDDGRIVYVGPARGTAAVRRIDAAGLVVSPGFIDPHTHLTADLSEPASALNEAYLRQGVTTAFIGNDGSGGRLATKTLRGLLEQMPLGTHTGIWSGHGRLRTVVLGNAARAPDAGELQAMQALLAADMQAGALGLSTGLFYAPGSFADVDEVIALAKVAAAHGGMYDSHIRDESDYSIGLLASIDEAVEIAQQADIAVHIAHIKALGPNVHGLSGEVIQRINAARARGLTVTADQYPWLASGTRLSNALIPRSAMEGGTGAMNRRLQDAAALAAMRPAIQRNLARRGGPQALLITGAGPYQGRTLAQLAETAGTDAIDAAVRVIVNGDPPVASFMMLEDDVRQLMRQPWVVTGSDGSEGHPRKYGTFPQKYHKYVAEQGLLSLEDFVHRSSGLTAEIFGLCGRGKLLPGYKADIAVWDPQTFKSNATYEAPTELAAGVRYLLVDGELAINSGEFVGVGMGQVLSRGECGKESNW